MIPGALRYPRHLGFVNGLGSTAREEVLRYTGLNIAGSGEEKDPYSIGAAPSTLTMGILGGALMTSMELGREPALGKSTHPLLKGFLGFLGGVTVATFVRAGGKIGF